MRTTTFIYALKDPRDNQIRYIGKANDPIKRFSNHINKCRDKNTHKRNWINNLRDEKLKPILEILEEVPIDNWIYYEKIYIKKYIMEGCDLMNYTEGGDGCTFGNKTSYKKGEGKKIVILDKEGNYIMSYNTITEASIFFGVSNGCLSYVLKKKRKTIKNNIFLYKEEYDSMTENDIANHIKWATTHKKYSNSGSFKFGSVPLHKIKKVYQYDKDRKYIREWLSASEAGRILGINKMSIGNCARETTKSAGGYFWTYKKII